MKKIIYILVFLFGLLFITSCYELDRFPQQNLSPGTYWKTESHAKSAVNACYAALRLDEVYSTYFAMDCLTDLGFGYDYKGYVDINRGNWTSRTNYVIRRWQDTYEGIARCNIVIRNVSAMEISKDVKNQVIGEARFLRAVFYFFLLDHFGGVPIYDETTDYNADYMNLLKPRSTVDQTREFILEDLKNAIEILPVNWPQSESGRATKGAAYALRGKVYLYNKQYDAAMKDFEEIVLDPNNRGYGYLLHPDYAELFNQTGHRSKEMIFSIQTFSAVGENLGLPYAWYMGTRNTNGSGWNNCMPSVDLVDSYETKEGKKFNWDDFINGYNSNREIREKTLRATLSDDLKTVASYPEFYNELLSMYEQRDPRMKQTILLPYTEYLGYLGGIERVFTFVYANGAVRANGFMEVGRYPVGSNYLYLYRKFVPEGNMDGKMPNGYRADVPIDFPIIRYADVLLMLAECYNETGRINDAVKYINKVRSRPSTNLPGVNSGPEWLEANTKEDVFQRIMQERKVEFAAEGLRYYDLRRWGLIKDIMDNKPVVDAMGDEKYRTKFEDKDYLWPIPAEEIDINSALEQNPGWQ